MTDITSDLAALLAKVDRPGDFYTSGIADIFAPKLEVDGVGTIALPLLPVQARELVAAAERAPFGRGAQTLVDTQVRRTWQFDADRVKITGKHWQSGLAEIVTRAAEGLGVTGPVEADFYKLLVYDEGSFFVSHRDTEKLAGMFATLVLVLPSVSTGGELLVRHKGREARLDLRCDEPSEAAFAAFYADCVHEVLPVTAGCRLTLVYNLVRKGKGPKLQAPEYSGEEARAAALLRAWAHAAGAGTGENGEPEKLVYPLAHAYTPAEISFSRLKGSDAAVATVLASAAPQADCDVHLALLTVEESGSAEYVDNGRSYRNRHAEPEFEVGEMFDRTEHLSHWQRPDGSAAGLGIIPLADGELSPPDIFEDMVPDDEEFQEATGNEGATYDRSYSRAALVLWPTKNILAVINQAGLAATLPYLEDIATRWRASGTDQQSPLWREAHALCGHMLSSWPPERYYGQSVMAPSSVAQMLTCLTGLADRERLETFLSGTIARGQFGTPDTAAIVGALGVLPAERATGLLAAIVKATAAIAPGPTASLLLLAARAPPHSPLVQLEGAAASLLAQLPGDPARAPSAEMWRRDSGVDSSVVRDVCAALCAIDAALADRAVTYLLAWPKTYGFDDILVPAARQLTGMAMPCTVPAVKRLCAACVAHLQARTAEPLAPPPDWSRVSAVGCKCPHCSGLSSFLRDANRPSWTLKAAESIRGHVELTIRTAICDVNVKTDQTGRPYTLVCTKNQASYERRVKQRTKDLKDLQILGA